LPTFVKECFDRVFLYNLRIAWVCPTVQILNRKKNLAKEVKPTQCLVYEVGERGNNEVVATEDTRASNNGFSRLELREKRNINDNPNMFPRYNGGPQGRPYYLTLATRAIKNTITFSKLLSFTFSPFPLTYH
jgi:hypothetical protein